MKNELITAYKKIIEIIMCYGSDVCSDMKEFFDDLVILIITIFILITLPVSYSILKILKIIRRFEK